MAPKQIQQSTNPTAAQAAALAYNRNQAAQGSTPQPAAGPLPAAANQSSSRNAPPNLLQQPQPAVIRPRPGQGPNVQAPVQVQRRPMAALAALQTLADERASRPLQGREGADFVELLRGEGVRTPKQLKRLIATAHLSNYARGVVSEAHGTLGFWSATLVNAITGTIGEDGKIAHHEAAEALAPGLPFTGAGPVAMATKFEALEPVFTEKPSYDRGEAKFFQVDLSGQLDPKWLAKQGSEYGYTVPLLATTLAVELMNATGANYSPLEQAGIRLIGNLAGSVLQGLLAIRGTHEFHADPLSGETREPWLDPDHPDETREAIQRLKNGLTGEVKELAKDEWEGIKGNNLAALKAAVTSKDAYAIMTALLPTLATTYIARFSGSEVAEDVARALNDILLVTLFNNRFALKDLGSDIGEALGRAGTAVNDARHELADDIRQALNRVMPNFLLDDA